MVIFKAINYPFFGRWKQAVLLNGSKHMIIQKIHSISIIGAGNIADHLSRWFHSRGYLIETVWSRNFLHAQQLSDRINATAVEQIGTLSKTSDLYLVCVSDDALIDVIRKLSESGLKNKLFAHTSGSTPITVFDKSFKNFGCVYPLQTFTKGKPLDTEEIPFFISGNNDFAIQQLGNLANDLSQKCFVISDEQRLNIHLAAVFACNFTNHLYCISKSLLTENQVSFDLLHPLIRETFQKAIENDPCEVQTGPAKRNDRGIIRKHLDLLAEKRILKDIYQLLSESILKQNEL